MSKNAHRYRIVIDFETAIPLNEEILAGTADAACVQLETIEDENGIRVVHQDHKYQPQQGTCMCIEYQRRGECGHVG